MNDIKIIFITKHKLRIVYPITWRILHIHILHMLIYEMEIKNIKKLRTICGSHNVKSNEVNYTTPPETASF